MEENKVKGNLPNGGGKAAGGRARASKLSPERRKEIAANAARARHTRPLLKASHAGILKVGDLEIPCYVLEDGTRILSQRGLNEVFGITHGGVAGDQNRGQKLPRFLGSKALKPFISNDLMAGISNTVKFTPPHGGNPVGGITATILPDICNTWLRAREERVLTTDRQLSIAQIAEILTRGFAHIGIIALVDEATGYQSVRPKYALQAYLEIIVRKELAAWAKRFPDEFYENIYKLKGWLWPGMGRNRYSVVAHYTNDLVYERLAPGLLEELKQRNPKDDKGNRPNKLHQWLTEDIGHPLLAQHLHSLVMFQRLAISNGYAWNRFIKMVDQVLPRRGTTLELPLSMPDDSSSE